MMTLSDAIEQATKFTEGATFHAGSEGWKAVMAVLLAEVKKNQIESRCCRDCMNGEETTNEDKETNEPQGPLPAAILADTADQIADALADFAMEVDIFNGLKYELMVALSKHISSNMVSFAKQLREDANK